MHAIVCHRYGGPEVMQYEEISRPEPAHGEILIQAEAIGVNYVDTMRLSGKHPLAPQPPFTPGIEVCGRIAAVGDQVQSFHEGDRVIGRCVTHGAYAEYVRVEQRFAASCPHEVSAEEGAALFVNGQTAYHALVTIGQLAGGDTVLITAAAGGVGTCAVQIAKIIGAHVLAAAGTDEKRALARRLGADVLIDYTQPAWAEKVLESTEERGANLIIESVGGDVARECLKAWAAGGRMVIYGKANGTPAVFSGDDVLFGNRTVCGLAVGLVIEDEALMRTAMDQLFTWMGKQRLRLQIGGTYPLRDAAAAHCDLVGRKTHGKLVLIP